MVPQFWEQLLFKVVDECCTGKRNLKFPWIYLVSENSTGIFDSTKCTNMCNMWLLYELQMGKYKHNHRVNFYQKSGGPSRAPLLAGEIQLTIFEKYRKRRSDPELK